MNEFTEDIKIDLYQLDMELMDQPIRFKKWADMATDAEFENDKAKDRWNEITAEKSKEVRKNYVEYGLAKVTDSSVASVVSLIQEVKDAKLAYLQAKHDWNILKNGTEAFEQRRSMLKHEVELYQTGWWSTDMKFPKLEQKNLDNITNNINDDLENS